MELGALIFGIVVFNAICYIKKRDRQVDETAACGLIRMRKVRAPSGGIAANGSRGRP